MVLFLALTLFNHVINLANRQATIVVIVAWLNPCQFIFNIVMRNISVCITKLVIKTESFHN